MSGIEYLIGWRYIRSSKRRFLSAVSLISILGITVGVMVIITVLSVMNGFREEIRSKMLDVFSHNTVIQFGGYMQDWEALQKQILAYDKVTASAPFIETQIVLFNNKKVNGIHLRGILPRLESQTSIIAKHFVEGDLAALGSGQYHIILGADLAQRLRVTVGDQITALSAQGVTTPAGLIPKMRRLEVVGIFDTGLSQFDRYVALAHIDDVRKLARLPQGTVSGLHLRVDDVFDSPAITKYLSRELGMEYFVSDWTNTHKNFFRALEMEKLLLLIIMMLIIIVAMFNIVSMLVMVVMEKRNDIAILRTLGMLPRQIMRVFITQGCLLGVLGNALGVLGGIALALNLEPIVQAIERATGTKFLAPDVYPITEVPSLLQTSDIVIVAALTFILTVLATIYPAYRATRIHPAQVLKAT